MQGDTVRTGLKPKFYRLAGDFGDFCDEVFLAVPYGQTPGQRRFNEQAGRIFPHIGQYHVAASAYLHIIAGMLRPIQGGFGYRERFSIRKAVDLVQRYLPIAHCISSPTKTGHKVVGEVRTFNPVGFLR